MSVEWSADRRSSAVMVKLRGALWGAVVVRPALQNVISVRRGRKLLVRLLTVTGSPRRATIESSCFKECLWSVSHQGRSVIHCSSAETRHSWTPTQFWMSGFAHPHVGEQSMKHSEGERGTLCVLLTWWAHQSVCSSPIHPRKTRTTVSNVAQNLLSHCLTACLNLPLTLGGIQLHLVLANCTYIFLLAFSCSTTPECVCWGLQSYFWTQRKACAYCIIFNQHTV